MKNKNQHEEFENLVHNIAWLRKDHKISKKRMAEILDISIKTLNKIESGILPPRLGAKTLCNIYYYFDIPVEDQVGQKLGE